MPRTTDAPTDAALDRLIARARASWGRARDHYPAGLDGFSYAAAVREADDAHETIGELVGALVALRAELAEARPVVALIERAATETYMGANEELLLMAKGRAFDRLIAAWAQLDHARALAARDGRGGGGEGMTTIDDLMYRAYPALRHYSPQAMALLGATGLTAERFAAITGVDVAAAAEYERALLELRAITPVLDMDELGDCLDRLAARAPGDGWFASHHAAVRWVRGEILAGKPWSAVRDSDPGHPAPALPPRST
jgi:hypothetical protein